MKKTLLLLILVCFYATAFCQKVELLSFEKESRNITKKGMLLLGGFSAASIISGAIGTNSSNSQIKYFNQMNVIWGSTNLLFAGLGYVSSLKPNIKDSTILQLLLHQNKVSKTFLFNAGLDVAYVTTGLYLTEKSKTNTNPAKIKGYGNAVMLQGGFLLLFDAFMYLAHNNHGKTLTGITKKLTIIGTPVGIAIRLNL